MPLINLLSKLKKYDRETLVNPEELAANRVHDLEQELSLNKKNLQTVFEELETANEELRSQNEEAQAGVE